ncbi:MAG: hypothetical protein JO173_12170, partial [Gammaproteobacteria bacterium]|nr:hypothetical protein [Gammaproteobacteria bacterium]
MKPLLFLGIGALVLTGCATAPPHNDQLESARAAVEALSAEPLAGQAAGEDL